MYDVFDEHLSSLFLWDEQPYAEYCHFTIWHISASIGQLQFHGGKLGNEKGTGISKKYDGSSRDKYEAYLYAETDEAITLLSLPGSKYWDHRKAAWFEAQDGLIEIHFKHKWYNVWHICEQVSRTNLIYVNITMPVTVHATGIEWIDLDLNYRVHLDHSVERLDQAEFEQNAQLMRYPPDLIEQMQLACREVEAGFISRVYPFDHERQVELYHQIKADMFK